MRVLVRGLLLQFFFETLRQACFYDVFLRPVGDYGCARRCGPYDTGGWPGGPPVQVRAIAGVVLSIERAESVYRRRKSGQRKLERW